ncbi:MAG TPA: hypothetical protein VIK55_05005 [Paludibacter sp.]
MPNNTDINFNGLFFKPINSFIQTTEIDGFQALRITKDPTIIDFDEPTYARLTDFEFQDGTIEVKVLSRLLPDAPEYARGFLGVTFRIDENDEHFEGIYIRPTNGRNENQVRRNRSTQYFSYPNHKFDHFREVSPGMYESYADMGLNEWIDLKIIVEGEHALFYLNNASQPVLVVNDLKMGANAKGGLGLWVEIGTEGFFRDLKITKS